MTFGMIKSVLGVWVTFVNIMCLDHHYSHHNRQRMVRVQMINGSNMQESVTT